MFHGKCQYYTVHHREVTGSKTMTRTTSSPSPVFGASLEAARRVSVAAAAVQTTREIVVKEAWRANNKQQLSVHQRYMPECTPGCSGIHSAIQFNRRAHAQTRTSLVTLFKGKNYKDCRYLARHGVHATHWQVAILFTVQVDAGQVMLRSACLTTHMPETHHFPRCCRGA